MRSGLAALLIPKRTQATMSSMTYEDHRRTLIEYLQSKVELADWHGVSDAANDLRVIEAQHEGICHEQRRIAAQQASRD